MFEVGWFDKLICVIFDRNVGEGVAILVTWSAAIFVAAIAFYFKGRRENRNFRNENSAYFHETENTILDASIESLHDYINFQGTSYRQLTHDEVKKHRGAIGTILNHFEIVAVGIRSGHLSESYIVLSERFRLMKSFMCLSSTVETIRQHYGNVRATRNYEILFIRTYFPVYKRLLYPLEMCTNRPFFRLSYCIFRIEYGFGKLVTKPLIGTAEYQDIFPPRYLDSDWVKLKKTIDTTRICTLVVLAYVVPLGLFPAIFTLYS